VSSYNCLARLAKTFRWTKSLSCHFASNCLLLINSSEKGLIIFLYVWYYNENKNMLHSKQAIDQEIGAQIEGKELK
jgi:hypothetical protein